MAIATARPRSPLELPPRRPDHEQASSRLNESLRPLGSLLRMPISLGVMLLTLGLTCLMAFTLIGVMFRNAIVRSEQAGQAAERRLGHEIMQLRASASTLQAQLDLRTHALATQAEEIERISAQLETLGNLAGTAGRCARARYYERR